MADEIPADEIPSDDASNTHSLRVMLADENQLEVDAAWDSDSALGGMTPYPSSTASLSSSIYQHVEENGRTYHRYKEGKYPLPNDEPEQDRLGTSIVDFSLQVRTDEAVDFQHKLYTLSLDNKLYLAPIPENPRHVLDVATGTGIWANEFADQHPEAHVLGTDLSPIQPQQSVSHGPVLHPLD
ncbi:hypothetical protein G7046_g8345 [Stylonectria norvegica]|nr:hypothetical protein G7046_g8345 [Stylonectria norvegica]